MVMKVDDIYSAQFPRIVKGAKLTRAREILRKSDRRIVVVVEDYASNKFAGFITRRDVITVTSAKSNRLVNELARSAPILEPSRRIEEAVTVLDQHRVYEAPVIDPSSKTALGVMAYRDILRAFRSMGYTPKAGAAADVMTIENIPLIPQNERITKAWSMLVYKGVDALVVVNNLEDKVPVGILTPKDLIDTGRWYFHREAEEPVRTPARVRTIMHRGVVVAYRDTPIEDIAKYMIEYDFTLVPVVNDEGRVIGVVTQRDVIRAYLEGIKPGRIPVPVAPPVEVAVAEKPVYTTTAQLIQQVMVKKAPSPVSGIEAHEIARPEIPAVTLNDTIEHLVKVMLRGKCNSVLVVDEKGRIIGTVSKRNLIYAIGTRGPLWRRRPYEKQFIYEVLNPDVPIVRANTPIEEVARRMISSNAGLAVVVDEKGLMVGVITKDELFRALAELRGEDVLVSNIMTPPKLSLVHPHHSLAHAVRKMKAYYLDALAVAEGDRVYGVVSENRLPFIALEDSKTGIRSRKLIWVRRLTRGGPKQGRYIKITPLLVEDVMVPLADTVKTDDTVKAACDAMSKHDVDGIPVVDEDGIVLGAVTKYDIIREFARAALEMPRYPEVKEARLRWKKP